MPPWLPKNLKEIGILGVEPYVIFLGYSAYCMTLG